MQGYWVAASAEPVSGARWERRVAGVRVAGGELADPAAAARGVVRRPPARAGLVALLSFDDPVELRLVAVDALAGSPSLAEALTALPSSVRTVVVDGVVFAVDEPLGRACWRLVLAGLAAHAQSRTTARTPGGRAPGRDRSNSAATSGTSSAATPTLQAPAGASEAAGTQSRWDAQRQADDGAAETSALIAVTQHSAAPGAGADLVVGGGPGWGKGLDDPPGFGAEDGEHPGQGAGEIGQQGDVDLDAEGHAGEVQRQAEQGVCLPGGRDVCPGASGQLPGDRASDGGRSAVAVPVPTGKRPAIRVRGGT